MVQITTIIMLMVTQPMLVVLFIQNVQKIVPRRNVMITLPLLIVMNLLIMIIVNVWVLRVQVLVCQATRMVMQPSVIIHLAVLNPLSTTVGLIFGVQRPTIWHVDHR
jgi:hypothetical protein